MTSSMGKLTLSYTQGGTTRTITFGAVTSINLPYNKSVMLTPIVSRSVKSTFAIETASSITITAEFARTSADEEETGESNAAWDARLVAMMDRWQAESNGFRLKYVPGTMVGNVNQRDNPYVPEFDYNGFVRQIDTRYSHGMTQFITGVLTFEVGTMYISRT